MILKERERSSSEMITFGRDSDWNTQFAVICRIVYRSPATSPPDIQHTCIPRTKGAISCFMSMTVRRFNNDLSVEIWFTLEGPPEEHCTDGGTPWHFGTARHQRGSIACVDEECLGAKVSGNSNGYTKKTTDGTAGAVRLKKCLTSGITASADPFRSNGTCKLAYSPCGRHVDHSRAIVLQTTMDMDLDSLFTPAIEHTRPVTKRLSDRVFFLIPEYSYAQNRRVKSLRAS